MYSWILGGAVTQKISLESAREKIMSLADDGTEPDLQLVQSRLAQSDDVAGFTAVASIVSTSTTSGDESPNDMSEPVASARASDGRCCSGRCGDRSRQPR